MNTNPLTRYLCSGFRSVRAHSMQEAAETFATREARKLFGRRGYCRTCTLGSWTQDGTAGEFSAFVGYRTGRNETTGRNVHLTVFVADAT